MRPHQPEAGFTLIELMISLGLFALIAVAGLALLDGVLGVQGRTETRLDRLADLQRTMFVLGGDVDQVAPGRIQGGGATIAFTRAAPGLGGAPVPLRYDMAAGTLVRRVGPAPQLLLTGVQSARWRFWDGTWRDAWPLPDKPDDWPRAVELQLQASGPGGDPVTLRRVIVLPYRAEEAAQ
jgi:general secretion pathway protein J